MISEQIRGWNSHGVYAKLSEILELEEDRGNEHTALEIKKYLKYYPDTEAIWVCYDPVECFTLYGYDDDGRLIDHNVDVERTFPNYKDQLVEVDLLGHELICNDQCGGYLYAVL